MSEERHGDDLPAGKAQITEAFESALENIELDIFQQPNTSFKLVFNRLDAAAFMILGSLLKNEYINISSLIIKKVDPSDDLSRAFDFFADTLPANTTLQFFSIDQTRQPVDLHKLLNNLQTNTSLQTLHFTSKDFSSREINKLAELIQKNACLRRIKLHSEEHNISGGLENLALKNLYSAVQDNTSLYELAMPNVLYEDAKYDHPGLKCKIDTELLANAAYGFSHYLKLSRILITLQITGESSISILPQEILDLIVEFTTGKDFLQLVRILTDNLDQPVEYNSTAMQIAKNSWKTPDEIFSIANQGADKKAERIKASDVVEIDEDNQSELSAPALRIIG